MKIAIIYHSGYGHTKIVAEHIYQGVLMITKDVKLISILEAQVDFNILHQADTLVFGCPTYFGTISADFKKFMEATGDFWYSQKWKDKLAAGFTNSSTLNGDKLNTLQQLSIFAAQHSMIWISTGILPNLKNNIDFEHPNPLASYMGLMTLSDNSINELNPPKGLETALLFGKRIAELTIQFKN
ncbi:flavodoxin family protein [Flavobacterium sp. 25HG05S-40]|uniref:flavodoxin family protein n=1 Tax=Flavobacterium sp. 25HG05S-40 TaxID=3458682 RepID=UPI0040446DD0